MSATDDTKSGMHERIARTWYAHPWTIIAGVATFAASLAGAWPLFVSLSHYYYTAEDAQNWHNEVERRLAWGDVRDARAEAIQARNLVNECRIKRSGKENISAMEQRVCDQYEDEFKAAQRRHDAAQSRAMRLSGQKDEK